ncbi:MAG: hydratase, partial [Oscillospiraceae bacterium]
ETDERVREYLTVHGRKDEYAPLSPEEGACYDAMITIDLSTVEPMAAMPFHPSEAYTIAELRKNAGDILRHTEKVAHEQFGGKVELKLVDKLVNGEIYVDQGIIAGCSGGMYDNIAEAAEILRGHDVGAGYFSLSVYPPSVPVNLRLIRDGVQQVLMESGALFKPCFCGPCFGAGDVPSNNGLSIRHTTRNFPNREGSKPGDGQLAAVMLMDARSIAATARNHGRLTAATEIDYSAPAPSTYEFDKSVYDKRVYFGFGKPEPAAELKFGPNIADWPVIPALSENLIMDLACVIHDPVTTTDELIPSGETSSYRSNPMKLASFTLSRREPQYVPRTEKIRALEAKRAADNYSDLAGFMEKAGMTKEDMEKATIGSVIFANKPGDGSAREQAASCQRVLGGSANICYEYATKRYRSNCINWGILPFVIDAGAPFDFAPGDTVYVPGVREKLKSGASDFPAIVVTAAGDVSHLTLRLDALTDDEREIILHGCLMNYYAAQRGK